MKITASSLPCSAVCASVIEALTAHITFSYMQYAAASDGGEGLCLCGVHNVCNGCWPFLLLFESRNMQDI